MMILLGFIADMVVQEAQARMSESAAAVADLRETQSASQGESAALQDTIKLQASELSALRTAKDATTARTADTEGQLEGLRAALQAAQEQSEAASLELRDLQDTIQQEQVCSVEECCTLS